ncbi:Wall-associated receptor kinase-like [Actinidia chinensis var. chinensis]|uniref:non-specific serine/threonine protein kinase n=1 Tax=Actinidia chinensis var. chinensis TaxID=1590841 RepID=A0A2R6RDC6_ACTCC|nr:Wall-associated receptor kinase-like [Actinidia chinensis var. chinensis]
MQNHPSFAFFPMLLHLLIITLFAPKRTLALEPACRTKCGQLEVKYPLGTGKGCGSPRFHPYVTCAPGADQLLLTTHTGSYPITSISYTTSTLTITPSSMSTCTAMLPSISNLGLDWASPFQLGPSTFILLSCEPPTSSLIVNGTPICAPSTPFLCASIYTCPAVTALGLPLFPATNTCCVYSPANLGGEGELDLGELKCSGYASVVSLGDVATDPSGWQYGVEVKYTEGGLGSYDIAPECHACEMSGGVCGYAPPGNFFVCVCKSGYNTSTDCNNYDPDQAFLLSSTYQSTWEVGLGLLASLIFWAAA